jgi:hypothetical protein
MLNNLVFTNKIFHSFHKIRCVCYLKLQFLIGDTRYYFKV